MLSHVDVDVDGSVYDNQTMRIIILFLSLFGFFGFFYFLLVISGYVNKYVYMSVWLCY